MFGLNPWGHHLTSVLLHALNAALVFLWLRQLTGATWRSLLVAALFAVHPLRVESVAWVAERKDVLSGSFGLLALIFYVRYARARSTLNYALALTFFALGLMSKPMLVTWPLIMLLLDYWPLNRMRNAECGVRSQRSSVAQPPAGRERGEGGSTLNSQLSTIWRLMAEKLPFFALSAVASVVAFVIQQREGAMMMGEGLPLGPRAGNALISYCRYLGKLFWPTNLAFLYPHPGHWPLAKVLAAGGLLLGLSVWVFLSQRRSPFLLMGWLWFVGMLVPVIGLVQVGYQAMADRYTYLPSLGILIAVVWGACELTRRWPCRLPALWLAGCAAVFLCLGLTRQQLRTWRDSEAVYRQALAVTKNNYIAHNELGAVLVNRGKTDEAIQHYQATIRLRPDYAEAHNNLGNALAKQGRPEEAIRELLEALRLRPNDGFIHNNLAVALVKQGRLNEAILHYQDAIRLNSNDSAAHYNLALLLASQGRTDEAIRHYQDALRLKPNRAEAHKNLGLALGKKGQIDQAIGHFQEATRLNPDDPETLYNLGFALEQQGRADEAIRQYQQVLRLKSDYADAGNNLGYLWAARGENLDQARALIEKAVLVQPQNAGFLDSLAWVLFKLNRPREALGYGLQAVEESARPDAGIYDHLGDIYAALQQRDQATAAWRKSLAVAPNPRIQKKLDELTEFNAQPQSH